MITNLFFKKIFFNSIEIKWFGSMISLFLFFFVLQESITFLFYVYLIKKNKTNIKYLDELK
jgi:hypothetical protein